MVPFADFVVDRIDWSIPKAEFESRAQPAFYLQANLTSVRVRIVSSNKVICVMKAVLNFMLTRLSQCFDKNAYTLW